ncbi:Integrase catalytic core protein [Phytophthora palmivora]|uniref:Integrase catalytic core protein n=1 Tax=Phytophthora palmivora TaxID=4796 RepID=A0A2P4YU27_9STRA|nr:Integrase catalytic core protein [Phytophthora palmivora]
MMAEAVSTAVYLINRSSNSTHSNVTPYEVCFKVKPRLEHLRVFGSLGYGHIDDVKRTKIESKSFKFKISRSVRLDEREVEGIYDTPSSQHHGTAIHVTKDGDEGTVPVDEERQSVADEPIKAAEEPILDVEKDYVEPEMNIEEVMRLSPPESSGSTGLELAPYHPQPEAYQEDRLVFHPEAELSDDLVSQCSYWRMVKTMAKSHARKEVTPHHLQSVAYIVETTDVPTTYEEAMTSHEADEWRKAMNVELYSHEKNATWTLVPRGPAKHTIGYRWVSPGNVTRTVV